MTSFADQVQAAVENAENEAYTGPARRYRAVLDQLAEGLRRSGVGARILPSADPRKLRLYLHAAYRPQGGSVMLSFFLSEDAIIVSGESSIRIETPDALEGRLLDYVKSPIFIEALHTLRNQAQEPVEARLRVDAEMVYAQGDILIAVPPSEQQKLAETAIGAPVVLEVERVEFPGNAHFDNATRYVLLSSAGLNMTVESVTPNGEMLRVIGQRAADA
jgi:hypothetical protein